MTAAAAQVVIFGGTGDLSRRKLMPALAAIDQQEPGRIASVVGIGRRPKPDAAFRADITGDLAPDVRGAFTALAPRVFYRPADVADRSSLDTLERALAELPGGDVGRLYYLALEADLFEPAVRGLADAGLVAERGDAWRRVVVEKPFGHDLESARALNRMVEQYLRESQVYRIDHYLGKETVQNLLGFRFHNAIFEPLWNAHHIELVQMTVAETVGMGLGKGRGQFYDETGGLRDMVQNHMLQLVSLIAMEPPSSLDPEEIRSRKVDVLRALRCPDPDGMLAEGVRARYVAGEVDGKRVAGFRSEEGVAPESTTETYVALRAEIGTWRWGEVPFLLRHGKRLPKRFTEVVVHFRTPPLSLFDRPGDLDDIAYRRALRSGALCEMRPNVLRLRIQPSEGIELTFGVKAPGAAMRMVPATLDFDYRERFGTEPPEAYQRLLLDALHGDPTLFLRADEIEAAWRWVDAVRAGWERARVPVLEYPAGTWGPTEADQLFHGCEGSWSNG
jgi:glucose-6-phosphate 1-dehydrogenase